MKQYFLDNHRDISCVCKKKYISAQQAGRTKEKMLRRANGPASKDLNVYRCQYCEGWHLGRPKRKRALKGRRRTIVINSAAAG